MTTDVAAADRWRAELAAWAIDPAILAAAPESPWTLPPEMFRADPAPAGHSPSRERALEALDPGDTVLDVGCGGGAGALALVPPAARILGVDAAAEMLASFAAAADSRAVARGTYQGSWPEIAGSVPSADVVVCHHVFYNVPDLGPFAAALSGHARRRVVVELTASHPLTVIGPLWRHFHGQDRPTGPTAGLARAVLAEAGISVHEQRWSAPPRAMPAEMRVRLTRVRLCLPADREPEVAALLADAGDPPPRELVTLWWDTVT